MKKNNGLIVSIFVVCLVVCLGASTATARDRLTLMLDWFPNVDHLPIYVAQHRGLFTKAGLEIEIISPSETADALKLAASGNVDLSISYEPQTIIAAARGLRIVAVGRLIEHPLTTLLFLQDSGIKNPADLEGKRIGYTVPGLMDVLLDAFAKLNGIKQYQSINVGFAIVQSLTAGKVDAVMGPFKTYETVTMKHKGYRTAYFDLEKWGIPDYDELVFVCGENVLKKNKRAIATFTRTVQQAIAIARQDPQGALEDYFKEVPEADRRIETDAFRLTRPYYAHTQKIDAARWQTFADFAYKYKLIEKPVDVKSIIRAKD